MERKNNDAVTESTVNLIRSVFGWLKSLGALLGKLIRFMHENYRGVILLLVVVLIFYVVRNPRATLFFNSLTILIKTIASQF